MQVSIRPIELADVDDEYVGWHQNEDGHLDWYTGTRRSFDAEQLRQELVDRQDDDHFFYYLIVAEDGGKVGTVRIGPIDLVNKTSDLVCLMGSRSYAGKGLAKKAIAIASRVAFEQHDIRRLHGGMFEANIPSIKAYEGGGWFIEARLRGYYQVDGKSMDRVAVACLNPVYFPDVDWPALSL